MCWPTSSGDVEFYYIFAVCTPKKGISVVNSGKQKCTSGMILGIK